MAEHAVSERHGARKPSERAPHPPPAEEHDLHEPLRITEYGERRIGLRAAGEIDLNSHEAWKLALRRVADLGEEVHLDLSGLAFIDVRGTTLLVDAAAALPEGRRVVVHGAPPALRRVIQVLWPDGAAAIAFEGER